MNWTLILLCIIFLTILVFILYQILFWWDKRQLNKIRRLYEQGRIKTESSPIRTAESSAAIEPPVEGSDGNESDAVGRNGIHESRTGECQDGDKPTSDEEIIEEKKLNQSERMKEFWRKKREAKLVKV
jgi:hypothetical protein